MKHRDEFTSGIRSFGFLDAKQSVMIEWKAYDARWRDGNYVEFIGCIHNTSFLFNADTKPDELFTLKCPNDEERSLYDFVFRIPIGGIASRPERSMVSLETLLDEHCPKNLSTLKERYQASYSLALPLLVQHTVFCNTKLLGVTMCCSP